MALLVVRCLALCLLIVAACDYAPLLVHAGSVDEGAVMHATGDAGDGDVKGADRALLGRAGESLERRIDAQIREEFVEEAQEQAEEDTGPGCSRTVPGKDIINPDAELGGDLVTEKDVGINACCRACRIMTFLGLNCKAVVWNTGNTCFYKTADGPLVHPGKGTAQEGGAVTVGFP